MVASASNRELNGFYILAGEDESQRPEKLVDVMR